MSGAGGRESLPHRNAVIAAVRAFVRAHGIKRGVFLAAQAIGMGERAARHAYEGGDFAADRERAARADKARLDLLLEQIAQLHAEARQIDLRGLHVGMAGASLDGARGVRDGAGQGVLRAGARGATT